MVSTVFLVRFLIRQFGAYLKAERTSFLDAGLSIQKAGVGLGSKVMPVDHD